MPQVAEDQGKMVINSAQVLGCNLGSVTSVFAASPTPDPVSIPQVPAAGRFACRHRHLINAWNYQIVRPFLTANPYSSP